MSPRDDEAPSWQIDLYRDYGELEEEANDRWRRMDDALGEVRDELSSLEGHRHQADKRVIQLSHECQLLRQALRDDAGYTDETLRDISDRVPRS